MVQRGIHAAAPADPCAFFTKSSLSNPVICCLFYYLPLLSSLLSVLQMSTSHMTERASVISVLDCLFNYSSTLSLFIWRYSYMFASAVMDHADRKALPSAFCSVWSRSPFSLDTHLYFSIILSLIFRIRTFINNCTILLSATTHTSL